MVTDPLKYRDIREELTEELASNQRVEFARSVLQGATTPPATPEPRLDLARSILSQASPAPEAQPEPPAGPTPWYEYLIGGPSLAEQGKTGALEWFGEQIVEPMGANLARAFGADIPYTPPGYATEAGLEAYHEAIPSGWARFGLEMANPMWAVPIAAPLRAIGAATRIAPLAKGLTGLARGIEAFEAAPAKAIGAVTKRAGLGMRGAERAIVEAWKPTGKYWDYPSLDVLRQQVFRPTKGRAVGEKLAGFRGVGAVVRAADPRLGMQTDIEQLAFLRTVLSERLASQKLPIFAPLRELGDYQRIFNTELDDLGNAWVRLSATKKAPIGDVIQFPEKYALTSAQKQWVKEYNRIWQPMREQLRKVGIDIGDVEGNYLRRLVVGKDKVKFEQMVGPRAGVVKGFERPRAFKTEAEGIAQGWMYEPSPMVRMERAVDEAIDRIATREMADVVTAFGRTPTQRMSESLKISRNTLAQDLRVAKHFQRSAIDAAAGKRLPEATLRKIEEAFPEQGARLRAAIIQPKPAVAPVPEIKFVTREAMRTARRDIPEDVLALNKAKSIAMDYKSPNAFERTTANRATLKLANEFGLSHPDQWSIKFTNTEAWLEAPAWVGRVPIKPVPTGGSLREIQKEAGNIVKRLQGEMKPLEQQYRTALGKARRSSFDAMQIEHPALRGYFFTREQGNAINKVIGREPVVKPLRIISDVATLARTMVATLDLSVIFLQGLYVLGRRPDIWAKSTYQALKFLIRPKEFERYLARNVDNILERVQYGGQSQLFEYYEAMPLLRAAAQRIPGVPGRIAEEAVRQTYGRAEAFFGGWGEVARNGLWNAWKPATRWSGEGLPQLAQLLDRMTGVVSTRAMGVGASQRAIENLALFAPRYTRAGVTFISWVFRGGPTGREALQAIGQTVIGGIAFYVGVCEALGQKPNLDPSTGRFMTVEVAGHHYGIGGILYSLVRLGGNIASIMDSEDDWNTPIDMVKLSWRDNPFINWWFNRTSAVVGGIVGLAEGRDYMGDPLETPADYAKFIAGKTVVPIALQPMITERETGVTPPRFAAEMAGMRTFPVSVFEERNVLRDQYAAEFGKTWAELDQYEREQLEAKYPDLVATTEEAAELRAWRGGPEEQQWYSWRQSTDRIQSDYISALTTAEAEVSAGRASGQEFRERVSEIATERRGRYTELEAQFPEVYQQLADPDMLDPDKRFDVAWDEYAATIYDNPELETPMGYDFDRARELETQFRQKWGEEIWQRIQEYIELRRREEPPLMQELRKAREVLEPYWEVQRALLEKYGLTQMAEQLGQLERTDPVAAEAFKQRAWPLQRIDEMVRDIRERMRATDPKLAYYYDKFYSG